MLQWFLLLIAHLLMPWRTTEEQTQVNSVKSLTRAKILAELTAMETSVKAGTFNVTLENGSKMFMITSRIITGTGIEDISAPFHVEISARAKLLRGASWKLLRGHYFRKTVLFMLVSVFTITTLVTAIIRGPVRGDSRLKRWE